MRIRAALTAVLLGLFALSSAPRPAIAESARTDEYQQHFRRGVELFRAERFEEALAEFVFAHELRGHFAILLNIAYCYSEMGRLADAIEYFERYLEEGGTHVAGRRRAEVTRELERLRSQVAALTITVDVAGATVLVDGREVGTSPLERSVTVRTGAVLTVEARLEGFRAARRELTIAPGTAPPPLALTLERIRSTGQLTVTTDPIGATVLVDGDEVGSSPWTGDVDAGSHQVEARAAGFVAGHREVAIASGGELTLRLELDRAGPPARLLVESSVGGSVVLVDNERVGTTPMAPLELSAGPHDLTVEAEGYQGWSGDVFLDGGQLTTADVSLASAGGGAPAPVFWSALGLAVATGVGAVVTGALTVARNDEVEDYLADVRAGLISDTAGDIEAHRRDLQEGGRTLALATDVLWISSAALAVTTLVLGFFTRFGPASSRVEIEAGGAVVQAGAALQVRGRF